MQTGTRPYVAVGAALAAASVVAVVPITPRPSDIPFVKQALRLVDSASILNVPFNFFQDLVNVPSTEIGALQQLGDSLIFSGPWWAASATNIWGEDPGDPGHFMSIIDMLFPFKALSGQGLGELEGFDGTGPQSVSTADIADGHMGLSQQIALFLDAEIPTSASSDADWSAPLYPTTEITGSTSIDRDLWTFATFTGLQKFPLLDNWFTTPGSELTGGSYNYGPVADPSAGVGANGAVPGDGAFVGTHPATVADFPGGLPAGDTVNSAGEVLNANDHVINLMPWSNLDFTFNPGWSFQNFFTSLEAPVDPSTYAQGFDLPSLTDLGRALQTLFAGSIIAFDPEVPGSFTCPGGPCDIPADQTVQALVQDISNMWPGNTSIENWLALASQTPVTGEGGSFDMANAATNHQVAVDNAYSQSIQQWFDVGNPTLNNPPSGVDGVDTPLPIQVSPQMQDLINFMHDSGVQNFFQNWANLAGYTPVDYASTWDPTAGGTAASSDWFTQLLGDFGMGGATATSPTDWLAEMSAQSTMFWDGLANIASFGIF